MIDEGWISFIRKSLHLQLTMITLITHGKLIFQKRCKRFLTKLSRTNYNDSVWFHIGYLLNGGPQRNKIKGDNEEVRSKIRRGGGDGEAMRSAFLLNVNLTGREKVFSSFLFVNLILGWFIGGGFYCCRGRNVRARPRALPVFRVVLSRPYKEKIY